MSILNFNVFFDVEDKAQGTFPLSVSDDVKRCLDTEVVNLAVLANAHNLLKATKIVESSAGEFGVHVTCRPRKFDVFLTWYTGNGQTYTTDVITGDIK